MKVLCPLVSAVNLGGLLLQALLEFWPRTRINPMDEEENEVNHGKEAVDGHYLQMILKLNQRKSMHLDRWI